MKKTKSLVTGPMDLDDLVCRLQIFGDLMSANHRSCGLRALKRVRSAIQNNGSEGLTQERYISRFPDLSDRQLGEEFGALVEITELPAVPSSLADKMVRHEVTMADAINAIALYIPCRSAQKRHTNAILRFCKALQLPPEAVPADGRFVKRSFRKLQPGDFSTSTTGFNTIRSRVRLVVRHVDLHGASNDRKAHVDGPWQKIADRLDGIGRQSDRLNLWPLIRFCDARNIPPASVNDDTVCDLLRDLEKRAVKDPFETARRVVYAWQKAQSLLPDFPDQQLSRIYKGGRDGGSFQFSALPVAFQRSWEDFVDKAAEEKEFNVGAVFDDIDALLAQDLTPDNTISKSVLANMRTALTYAAYAHAHTDRLQIIDQVLNPECVGGALKIVFARQQRSAAAGEKGLPKPQNPYLKNTANILLRMAKLQRVDPSIVEAIRQIAWRVHPDFEGLKRKADGTIRPKFREAVMGQRHRERLREFAKPGKLRACNCFCGCRRWCKRFRRVRSRDRVRSSVRPFVAALTEAAGRYGDQRTGAKSHRRAVTLWQLPWFSRSGYHRSLRPYGALPSHTSRSGFLCGYRLCHRRISIFFSCC